ncbi:DNA-methyltransferase [Bacillus cytotoxicus]|uniref:Methyltransferase n=1 Tax=Bacillus cytotoxicus TaxID=580165 RepID=A0AAX2CDG7_9BACI|nr:site-specific DNA-methyltransferase [Bacillus cytotoxicus]QTR83237.1 site-specific DNA-methyltransferase [Bacillus cytotoxicus]QTR86975.1 site-specific DNA-methyltransferase [Bacillus cytotoxicus]SCL85861.1 DNA methylase N-4/N-6 domain protein [Bacillus cytotoxicus]
MFLNKDQSVYYTSNDNNFSLILEDSLVYLKKMEKSSVDMIFADPPYFLSNDGITCSSGRMISVNKGEWDKKLHIEDIYQFNYAWLKECIRILKPNGTLWVSGTHHNIYSVGFIIQQLEMKILNNITWYKRNAPPNLSCRYFTHSTETILWAKKNKKAKHFFNYKLMKEFNEGKQMRDVWEIPAINKKEKVHGDFPTQKPLKLMERIILASTQENDLVLDPFNGSGSTGIACISLKRRYIGIDDMSEHLDLSIRRYEHLIQEQDE